MLEPPRSSLWPCRPFWISDMFSSRGTKPVSEKWGPFSDWKCPIVLGTGLESLCFHRGGHFRCRLILPTFTGEEMGTQNSQLSSYNVIAKKGKRGEVKLNNGDNLYPHCLEKSWHVGFNWQMSWVCEWFFTFYHLRYSLLFFLTINILCFMNFTHA